ncbi:MAG: hypothetical protein RL747_1425 [Bacteroidota bacterium]
MLFNEFVGFRNVCGIVDLSEKFRRIFPDKISHHVSARLFIVEDQGAQRAIQRIHYANLHLGKDYLVAGRVKRMCI